MRGKHGKHTEHYKFSITEMAEPFSRQLFLNHARLPRVLIVPVRESKEMHFLGFFSTFKWIHQMQFPTQELDMIIYCVSEIPHLPTTSTLRTQVFLEKVCYILN